MMRQIRRGTFETNSSSVHSITMCSETDYDKWVNGELFYDRWGNALVEKTPKRERDEGHQYLTYEQFNDYEYIDYETFEDSYKTASGEKVIAFGYYGEDR